MTDTVPSLDDDDIPSPCIHICRLDTARVWCTGCGRHIDEIRLWRTMNAAEKQAVWTRLNRAANPSA